MSVTLAPVGRPKKRSEATETTRILASMGAMIREMISRRKDYSVTDYVIEKLEPIVRAEYIDYRKNPPPPLIDSKHRRKND